MSDVPDWMAGAKVALPALEVPGPPNADLRVKVLQARRPHLGIGINEPSAIKKLRRHVLNKLGKREGIFKVLKKRLLRRDLKAFVKEAWGVLEPGTKLEWNWHLDVICDALMDVTAGKITRLLINVPPGHMKSMLVNVFWPAWEWLTNPGIRSIFVSYHSKLTNRDSRKCRDLINSDWYQSLIPKLYGEGWNRAWTFKGDSNLIESYATELHGVRDSTSLTGAGTGLRGDKVVIDDPMNAAEYPTEEKLESVISTFDTRFSSRLNDMASGAIVIIMQRLHENDLSGHVLARDEREKAAGNKEWVPFTHICLRSEYDPSRPNAYDRRKLKGELLHPAKFPQAVINAAKIQLGAQYDAQHQQDPMPQSGGIFEMCKLRFFYPERGPDGKKLTPPIHHREKDANNEWVACEQGPLPKYFDEECLSWDMAFKDFEDNDFVAGGHWARKGSNCYLLEQEYGHFSFTKTVEKFLAQCNRCPAAFAKYVEDKANGSAVIDTLKDTIFGLIAVEPRGGKVARANAVSKFVSAGNIWLPHPDLYPWVHALLGEMRAFPKGKHDDQVDQLTQALINMVLSNAALMEAMTKE